MISFPLTAPPASNVFPSGLQSTGTLTITPSPPNTGGAQGLAINAPTDPGDLTADYNQVSVKAGTITFDAAYAPAGGIARWAWFHAPTLAATGVGPSFTQARTLQVDAPIEGANVTFGTGCFALSAVANPAGSAGALQCIGTVNSQNAHNNALTTQAGFVVINAVGSQAGNPMGLKLDYQPNVDITQAGPPVYGAILVGMNLASTNSWPIADNFTELRSLNVFGPAVKSNTLGNWTVSDATTLRINSAPTVDGTGVGTVVLTRAWGLWVTPAARFDAAVHLLGGTATTAGGAPAAGISFGSAASPIGVYFGSGAPTITAPQGSLYLRTDGSSTSTRAYINTTGAAVWTPITTVA